MLTIFSLSAAFLTIISLILLFFAWKKVVPVYLHTFFLCTGWIGLLATLALWGKALGFETGTVVMLCTPALIAWIIVLANSTVRKPSSDKRQSDADARSYRHTAYQGRKQILQHVFRFFQVTLLSLIAGLSFSTALTRVFNMYIENAMATTVLLLPFVWGLAAWWSAADDRSWRPALGLFCISVVCSIVAIV